MSTISFGDLASGFRTQRQTAEAKRNIERLSHEATTGQTADIGRTVSGDFGTLASIDRTLGNLNAYGIAITEAQLMAGTMQSVLGTVSEQSVELATNLLSASNAGEATTVQVTAQDARTKFDTVIALLNTRTAERALFAGNMTDRNALASAEDMLADIRTAVAGQTDAAGVVATVKAWFEDAGGGFETMGYLGSDTSMTPLRVADGEGAALGTTASDPEIRSVLEAYALAALVAEDVLTGDAPERAAILRAAGEAMLSAEDGLALLRATVGSTEAQIEAASVRNQAETYALELARGEIVGVDQFEAAAKLTDAASQLEAIYAITARLSRLTLSDYL